MKLSLMFVQEIVTCDDFDDGQNEVTIEGIDWVLMVRFVNSKSRSPTSSSMATLRKSCVQLDGSRVRGADSLYCTQRYSCIDLDVFRSGSRTLYLIQHDDHSVFDDGFCSFEASARPRPLRKTTMKEFGSPTLSSMIAKRKSGVQPNGLRVGGANSLYYTW